MQYMVELLRSWNLYPKITPLDHGPLIAYFVASFMSTTKPASIKYFYLHSLFLTALAEESEEEEAR